MNERFEKLLAEAFFDEAADQADTKVYELNDGIIQKFAELIIAECIDQVEVFNARMDAGPRHIVEAIKQHFGVKE